MRRALVSLASLLALGSCADDRSAGGGDEMGNFVNVAVVGPDGLPVVGARVSVRRSDEETTSNAPWSQTTTDASGKATLSPLPEGAWTLVALQGDLGRCDTLVLPAPTGSRSDTLRLASLSTLEGAVDLAAGEHAATLTLAGLGMSSATDSVGRFRIQGVPAGPIALRGRAGSSLRGTLDLLLDPDLDTNVGVLPLPTRLWSDSLVVVLDAGTRGISLVERVEGLPVPIRLDSANLDFSRTLPDGSDLRATRADGRPLAVSLEDFDPSTRTGVLWVLVDTLLPGLDGQRVVVRWGRPGMPASNAPVFAPSAGWTGAWHLGQNLSDATGRGNDATDSATTVGAGAIGKARILRRASMAHLVVPGVRSHEVDPSRDATIEAWARLDARGPGWDAIASFDDIGVRIQRRGTDSVLSFGVTDSLNSTDTSLATWGTNGTTNIADGRFHHVVGMRRDDSLMVFVDGRREIAEAWPKLAKRGNVPLQIGRNAGSRHWDGAIDEVRLARRAFRDEWIRASYEAASPTGKLLRR